MPDIIGGTAGGCKGSATVYEEHFLAPSGSALYRGGCLRKQAPSSHPGFTGTV